METLIVTLYCGEKDYDECCKSLEEQTYKDFDHLVISNQPEVIAHKTLYESFKKNSDYKYLIKIDADIVLNSNNAIQTLISAAQSKINGNCPLRVTADVDDYFTGILLQGIHLYSQEVNWNWDGFAEGCTTPDRLDDIHTKRLNRRVCKLHQVLGKHCYYASEKQAFHFGYHRALKGQADRCMDVWNNYVKKKENLLWKACLGIFTGLELKDFSGYCYNEKFDEIFAKNINRNISERDVQRVILSFFTSKKRKN